MCDNRRRVKSSEYELYNEHDIVMRIWGVKKTRAAESVVSEQSGPYEETITTIHNNKCNII